MKKENYIDTSHWRKLTALILVSSLLLTLVEPVVATQAITKEKINLNKDSYHQLRKVSELMEGGKLASASQVMGRISTQISPDELLKISSQYNKQVDQQLKQSDDINSPQQETWTNGIVHALNRISALHIGRRTVDLVRHSELNNIYHKMPSWDDIMQKVLYMSGMRGLLKNDYQESLFPELIADYYEIYDERWKLSYEEIKRDPLRLGVLNDLEILFHSSQNDFPQLGINDVVISVRKGIKVIGLNEQGDIETAMLAPFIVKKRRFTDTTRTIPYANSSRDNEALFSMDVDLLDSLASLREEDSDLYQKIVKAIPMREFKVQELYLNGMEFAVAHMDPSVLEIPGHEELEIFLRQVAESKLREEKKGEQENSDKENSLEDKIAETRAYIKYRWSDQTLENYKSIVRELGQGIVTKELLELIYELRDVPGLGDLVDQLHQGIQYGRLDLQVTFMLYSAADLLQRGETVISLNLNLMDTLISIVTYNQSLGIFYFYSLNEKINENVVINIGELLNEISISEGLATKVDFLLDARVNHYADKLFKFLRDGKVVDNNIISRKDGKTLVELKSLSSQSTPHLSALHIGTLIEILIMIYEMHQENPLLDQLFAQHGLKSFDDFYVETVNRVLFQGREISKKGKWMQLDIKDDVKFNNRVGTETLRLYLRDHYLKVFEIPFAQLDSKQQPVANKIQEVVDRMFDSGGAFRFLGIKGMKVRVYEDRYLIDKVKNRGIFAFYMDEGWWKHSEDYRSLYMFPEYGDLAVGNSLLDRWAQLDPNLEKERLELEEGIYDLVVRELMARTLNQYDDYNPIPSYGPGGIPGFDLEFDRIHEVIDTYPEPESKSVIEGVLDNFPVFLTKSEPRRYAAFNYDNDGEFMGRLTWDTAFKALSQLRSQERLLSLAKDILANTVTPLILFGITLGVGLSGGGALAFDGTILPQNAIKWEPIFLGGIIGATVLGFASHNTKDLKKSMITKRDEIKSIIFKIAGALKGSFESLHEFFSVIASKDPNIRILINGEDPVSVAEAKDLIEKIDQALEESTDDKIGNKLQFIVVGNFHGEEVSRVLAQPTVKGISSKYVKKIIDRPINNEKIDLKEVLDEMNEDKTFSKEEYTLWIMNSALWDISKFIESIAQKLLIKNGTQLLYVDMIRGAIVGASQ